MGKMERLNGWQRLWLVLGIVYLAMIVTWTISIFPSKLTIGEYLNDAKIPDGAAIPNPDKPRFFVRIDDKWIEVQALAYNPDTGEEIYCLNDKWSEPSLSLQYVKLPHPLSKDEIKVLRTKQTKVIGRGILLWIGLWIMLYVIGISIAWIRAGFKK